MSTKDKNGKIKTVACSVCKEEKYANPKALEARIKKFGSVEGIELEWICKSCNTKVKISHSPERKRDETGKFVK